MQSDFVYESEHDCCVTMFMQQVLVHEYSELNVILASQLMFMQYVLVRTEHDCCVTMFIQ